VGNEAVVEGRTAGFARLEVGDVLDDETINPSVWSARN
jgi:hypothetical protein